MVKFVESELVQLRNEVYEMWTLVYKQMEQVKQAVLDMDADTAKQVLMRERRVDTMELKIDSKVEDIIALYTPVAIDLRFVLAMFKINNDLERIGDYADGMARFVKDAAGAALDAELVGRLRLEEMFSTVLLMMDNLKQALMDEDPAKAASVLETDDILDEIKNSSIEILVDYAKKHTDSIYLCIGLAGVIRKIERTGDHLSNVAEDIVFYIDAKVLKHNAEQEQAQ